MLNGGSTLQVVSLNLGGRNTNPLEFVLTGDSSEIAAQAMAMLRRATKALQDVRDGPQAMPSEERAVIGRILANIYQGADSAWRAFIEELFQCQTWSKVLSRVASQQSHLFNALNLCTLKLKRPSVWEDPASCRELQGILEYLTAWEQWYCGLDRESDFWREEAPRNAEKRSLDVATGFAGLLLFDVMSVCSARCALGEECDDVDFGEDDRWVPFRKIANVTLQFPASSLDLRHHVAENFIRGIGTDVVFAQEAREFAHNHVIAAAFLPPFSASDGFTAVFLRKGAFTNVTDISVAVQARMQKLADAEGSQQRKAWLTNAKRLAAVRCQYQSPKGDFQVCLVSLHCSQSDGTASFLVALRGVLEEYDAESYIVGMDSNSPGKDAAALQRSLRSSGFEIGQQQDQVTVVKQRTHFQTQVKKAGETDCSHKDYIVSWGSARLRRETTVYTPDLRTVYGVEQESRRCVRLPNTQWPFDHCSVVASFKPRRGFTRSSIFQPRAVCSACAVILAVVALLTPLAGLWTHKNPYGPPGIWLHDSWPGTPRVGICEAEAPCKAGWEEHLGMCYKASPRMVYNDAEDFCHQQESGLVSIGSMEENEFLTESMCPAGEFCWIGLRCDTARVDYWWASGEPVGYTRLVRAQGRLFPLFPASRDTEREVSVLSAHPEEMSGCRNVEFLVSWDDFPTWLVPLRLLGSAVALVIGVVLLLLRRPPQRTTTLYLLASFFMGLSFHVSSAYAHCMAEDINALGFGTNAATLIDALCRPAASVWAMWIILRRVSLLYPSGFPRLIFKLINIALACGIVVFVLFIDAGTSQCPTCIAVILSQALVVSFALLYGLFMAPIAFNLYRTWAFMKQEAATGRSKEGGSSLSSQVRSAQVHFLVVTVAIITGAFRWVVLLAWMFEATSPRYVMWVRIAYPLSSHVDSIANDLCAYVLVVMNMDDAVARAKGITTEVATRAAREVDQHQLAVRLLKAAPTSQEQLAHFAMLEREARDVIDTDNHEPYMVLKSAVQAESCRIHHLMRCVRIRDMTMPLRYQYLIDIPPMLEGAPRQHVPENFLRLVDNGDSSSIEEGKSSEAASEYFDWLYAEAEGTQQVFFHQVQQMLQGFNSTPWPSDLRLASEQFPWSIWPGGPNNVAARRLQGKEMEAVSPGSILMHKPRRGAHCQNGCGRYSNSLTRCFVLDATPSSVRIHRSGSEGCEEVSPHELRRCSGGAVFVPGPMKRRQRCQDKIEVDYEGKEPWPAAASLVDICRCSILLDDPYAIAVLVAYIRRTMRVVRLKNRFGEDVLERMDPEALQAMFYNAAEIADCSSSSNCSSDRSGDRQYRDISINVQVTTPSGAPFICEIQVTLSNLAILKKADTKLYTVRRMQSPQELRNALVFADSKVAG